MLKNVAGQYVAIYAHDISTDQPKTGDAPNITAYISKDAGAAAQSNDVNPTELDNTNMKGIYIFTLTQAESNCNLFALSPTSSTSGIQIDPIIIHTNFGTIVEPGVGAPDALPTFEELFTWWYMEWRNLATHNRSTKKKKIRNDAGTVLAEADLDDDGTEFSKGQLGAPS